MIDLKGRQNTGTDSLCVKATLVYFLMNSVTVVGKLDNLFDTLHADVQTCSEATTDHRILYCCVREAVMCLPWKV